MQKKILVLPGMGDIYWVLTKLQSFLDQEGIETPLLYTWELQPHKKDRSKDYIKRVPFVEYGGSWVHDQNIPEFKEIYFGTTWLIRHFKEFDYLFSVNGVLRNGFSLESHGLDEYDTDWYFPLNPSAEEDEYRIKYAQMGNYVVAYFNNTEMYVNWTKCLPDHEIFKMLEKIHNETGNKVVLTGSSWDRKFASHLKTMDVNNFIINMTGDTSIDQLFALMQEANGMIGWCGGNTIMSTYFKKPTVIIWSKYFSKEGFYKYSVPPDSHGSWYEYKVAERDSATNIADTMIRLLRGN